MNMGSRLKTSVLSGIFGVAAALLPVRGEAQQAPSCWDLYNELVAFCALIPGDVAQQICRDLAAHQYGQCLRARIHSTEGIRPKVAEFESEKETDFGLSE